MAASHSDNTVPHLHLGKRIGTGQVVCCRSPDLISYCSRPICSMLGTPICLVQRKFLGARAGI